MNARPIAVTITVFAGLVLLGTPAGARTAPRANCLTPQPAKRIFGCKVTVELRLEGKGSGKVTYDDPAAPPTSSKANLTAEIHAAYDAKALVYCLGRRCTFGWTDELASGAMSSGVTSKSGFPVAARWGGTVRVDDPQCCAQHPESYSCSATLPSVLIHWHVPAGFFLDTWSDAVNDAAKANCQDPCSDVACTPNGRSVSLNAVAEFNRHVTLSVPVLLRGKAEEFTWTVKTPGACCGLVGGTFGGGVTTRWLLTVQLKHIPVLPR